MMHMAGTQSIGVNKVAAQCADCSWKGPWRDRTTSEGLMQALIDAQEHEDSAESA